MEIKQPLPRSGREAVEGGVASYRVQARGGPRRVSIPTPARLGGGGGWCRVQARAGPRRFGIRPRGGLGGWVGRFGRAEWLGEGTVTRGERWAPAATHKRVSPGSGRPGDSVRRC